MRQNQMIQMHVYLFARVDGNGGFFCVVALHNLLFSRAWARWGSELAN